MRVFYQNEKKGLYVNGIATKDTVILKARQLEEIEEVRKGNDIRGIFVKGKVVAIVIEMTPYGLRCTASKPSSFKLRVIFDREEKRGDV